MLQRQSKQITLQTRLNLDEKSDRTLYQYSNLLSKVERKLFLDICKDKTATELKAFYLKEYAITARQFNSCRIQAEGKMFSYKEHRAFRISQLKTKIEVLKKRIPLLKNPFTIHHKKRRLFSLEQKLKNLEKDTKISICFGGKDLFHKQFYKEENGYLTHEDWRKDWTDKRNSGFFLVGSKDETAGNQTCQISEQADGKFSLFLRLPNSSDEKYIIIKDLDFSYRKQDLLNCIKENTSRKNLQKQEELIYKDFGLAINYRFLRDKKGWRVFVTFALFQPEWLSNSCLGNIGVDINIDHLAVVEIDRFGNFLKKMTIPLCLYGKSKNEAKALIGDAVKELVSYAESVKKPIVIEKLDFSKKKAALKEAFGHKYARMLSSFAYASIIGMIKSRAWSRKIEIFEVNPTYTSIIGRINFAKRYGLSIHHAASFVIARRQQGFSENPPHHSVEIPDGKGHHVAFFLPEWNRKKHVWSFWAEVSRKLKAALAAHFQTGNTRSSNLSVLVTKVSEKYRRDSGMLDINKTARLMQLCESANV